MSLKPLDFDQWFTAAAGTDSGGAYFTVRLDTAELSLPTGRVAAMEPGYLPQAFVQAVPPGRYPVTALVMAYRESPDPGAGDYDDAVAAARVTVRDEPAVSWEMALRDGQSADGLADDEFYGYPADGGIGCFTDEGASAQLLAGGGSEWLEDVGMDVLDRPTAVTVVTDPDGEPVLAAFTTGCGDGHYPTWVGRNAAGDITCFVTDFFLLHAAQPGT
jgi:hypothetical protein